MADMTRVVDRVAATMEKVGKLTTDALRLTSPGPRIVYPLSLQEQYTRFLHHTPDSFAHIARTRGMDELQKYVAYMLDAGDYLRRVEG